MKDLIEKEIHGWGVEVEKDGRYTTLFADEVMYEILERELR